MKKSHSATSYIKSQLPAICSIIFLLLLGVYFYLLAHPAEESSEISSGYSLTYENAVVTEILSDNCEPEDKKEGTLRGRQELTALVETGPYAGNTYPIVNLVGPLYGHRLSVGDSFIIGLSAYEEGQVYATVYEYDRAPAILILIGLFCLATILVGGKTGAKSLVGLLITIAALLLVLLPLLFAGWPTLPTTLLVCSWITCMVFLVLSGWDKKTVCAILGTVAGMVFATLFALLAQVLLRIDGYREEYAEPLMQLRHTGESLVGIRYLLVAGVMISALGAVMDVAMSISSAIREISLVGERLTFKQLFISGMNIGRDMVGTMTNTLILAIIGSGMMLIMYIASLNLPLRQFLSSPYLALELVSSLSSSIGVILTVPLTALISATLYAYTKKEEA